MPCGSPCGIFTLYSAEELAELLIVATAALSGGRRTSLSGGAKSGTKQWDMTPQQMLVEIKYAMRQKRIIPARVTKTYMDIANPPCPVTVPNEQV